MTAVTVAAHLAESRLKERGLCSTMTQAPTHQRPHPARVALFLAGAALSATPWCRPWMALALGMVLALAGLTAFDAVAKKVSRILIQTCIVMLGLRLALGELAH